ncbi:MAG: protein phosphatase 2C domain-containing protein [Desulfobacterales bacterium]|nr:protein phosphatase 2C domain-containing protein [Desulfobacterales bacterium]
MQTRVDDFLKIGTSHRICQDYVISGMTPVPHVILADGCSSSDQTDTGARILTHLARQYLISRCDDLEQIDYKHAGDWIIRRAEMIAQQLGLNRSALDATLMIAFIIGCQARIMVYGDGVIGLVDYKGRRSFLEISFTGNAPYYLSYKIDSHRDQLYREKYFMKQVGQDVVSPDSAVDFIFSASEYPIIIAASDGIVSFIDKTGAKADLNEIFGQFTAFKNLNGAFLKRRVKRAVQDYEKSGLSHYDDLSVGAFFTEMQRSDHQVCK